MDETREYGREHCVRLRLVVGVHSFEFNGHVADFAPLAGALDGWLQAIATGATPAEQAALAARAGASADTLHAADVALQTLGTAPKP